MKKICRISVVLALGVTCGLIPSRAVAAVWDETADGGGDANELTGSSQAVTGSGALTSITGDLSTATDRDIYQIRITDPNSFQFFVSFTEEALGNADTALAIFNSSGIGLVYNDNIGGGNERSILNDAGPTVGIGGVTVAGDYYIAIMGGLQTFRSGAADIWLDNAPFDVQKVPDGGGAFNLTGYNSTGGTLVGNYTITITGGVTPVPEPAYYGIAFAVMGLVVAGVRYRKSRKVIPELPLTC